MSRFCPKCNRPLVIFRGFWQCKHCIEEKEKENWSTKEHMKIDLENAEKIMKDWEKASKKELLAYESRHGIMTKRTRKLLKKEGGKE